MSKPFYCLIFCFLTHFSFSQNCNGFENFPEGEEKGIALHHTCRKLMDAGEFELAFPIWQELIAFSPAGSADHFIDGVRIYKDFIGRDIENADKTKKNKQTIVDLYEQWLTCLSPTRSDSNAIMERFAFDISIIEYYDTDKTLTILDKTIKMNGNNTSAYILPYYADFVIHLYRNDELSKEECLNVYDKLKEIKDANEGDKYYEEEWKYVEKYFQIVLD